MKKTFIFFSIASIAFSACSTNNKLTRQINCEKFNTVLADSILAYALDHEALFTLADTLKPISSVKFLRFTIAKDSTKMDGEKTITANDSAMNAINEYQQVCNALSKGDWQFVMMPFNNTQKNMRNIEIYVVRKSVFAKKIAAYQSFFGQWGFTPFTNPSTVLPVIEYESKWDRNRGYGYLFGYPSYAVDFFVEASKTQAADSAKKLVPRNFFAIPVYAGSQGYFTYATPKDYQPSDVDSNLYRSAALTLEKYNLARKKYSNDKGVKALKLWQYLNK